MTFPGADTTTIFRLGSDKTILYTFSTCVPDAKELPPNFTTFTSSTPTVNFQSNYICLLSTLFSKNAIDNFCYTRTFVLLKSTFNEIPKTRLFLTICSADHSVDDLENFDRQNLLRPLR